LDGTGKGRASIADPDRLRDNREENFVVMSELLPLQRPMLVDEPRRNFQ
jgi:hypothetical protein